ncbi:MAG: TetR/AcrR family transcriptional regulator [Pseudomonadota bacterium]
MPRPQTADRILRAARALFEREGADAVSMRRVAAKAGVSPMAIYRHFADRDALLKRICDDSFEEIARHWRARNRGPDALARIVALQDVYLDYALAYPHLFDHAFTARREDARRYPEDFRARRSPTLNEVADAVVEAQAAGALRRDDPWEVAMTLWAHSHGLIALYRAGRFNCPTEEFRVLHARALRRLLEGIAIVPGDASAASMSENGECDAASGPMIGA